MITYFKSFYILKTVLVTTFDILGNLTCIMNDSYSIDNIFS